MSSGRSEGSTRRSFFPLLHFKSKASEENMDDMEIRAFNTSISILMMVYESPNISKIMKGD